MRARAAGIRPSGSRTMTSMGSRRTSSTQPSGSASSGSRMPGCKRTASASITTGSPNIAAIPRSVWWGLLMLRGVLGRFRELQIVSAENNTGWLPYYLQRRDPPFERGRYAGGGKLSLKPGEYFQRQMPAPYIDDYVGVANRQFIGVD